MNKADFLAQATALALPLHPVTVEGVSFYVTESSMLDVRLQIERGAEGKGPATIEQRLAAVMLDEAGAPLFDQANDEDMAELRAVMNRLPASFAGAVHKAREAFDKPTAAEVDDAGN